MPSKSFSSYQSTLDYLYSLQHFGIKLGLENISHLLEYLNQPQQKFPAVLIGGTNGKGSTAAFLSSIFRQAGYKTGLYTSPHLVDFRERMQVNGEWIPQTEVVELTEQLKQIISSLVACDPSLEKPKPVDEGRATSDNHPTYFEVTTAMAFNYFARQAVDLAVVEVGLGGRFDATNVLSPVLALITNVDYDHTEHLGESLAAIAAEKAEIIKPGGTLLTGEQREEILNLFEQLCRERGAEMIRLEGEVKIKRPRSRWGRQAFDLEGKHGIIKDLEITLLGEHQQRNAALAVLAAIQLRKKGWTKIGGVAIHEGLKQARWPGRLEVLQERPAIVLDGAHNPAGSQALARALAQLGHYNKLILVFGVMQDKDYKNMLAALCPFAAEVILTKPQMERAEDPQRLVQYAHDGACVAQVVDTVAEACERALLVAKPEDLILVTGSLFTVGEAKEWWEKRQGLGIRG